MNSAIISFPGSNCDNDLYYLLQDEFFGTPVLVDYRQTALPQDTDIVFIPGGFAYGDYLRSGAIARFAPVMAAVKTFAAAGGFVVGICNGFQILTEAGLLPGALLPNQQLNFICRPELLRVENHQTAFTAAYAKDLDIVLPIAHGAGNYYCDAQTLAQLRRQGQIVFTYRHNPNGSVAAIAGITNEAGNVLGMMPHPERASTALLGGVDGRKLFDSLMQAVATRRKQEV